MSNARNLLMACAAAGAALFATSASKADDDIEAIIKCNEIAACRVATGMKGFADGIDATSAAMRSAASKWISGHPDSVTTVEALKELPLDQRQAKIKQCIADNSNLASVCEGFYLSDAEIDKLHPRPARVQADPKELKDELLRQDDSIYQRMSMTCAAKPVRGDCRGALEDLNDLEAEMAKRNSEKSFHAAYPNGLLIRSSGLAGQIGVAKSAGKWDVAYSGAVPAQAAGQAPAASSVPRNPALDLAELGEGCRSIVASGFGVDVDRHMQEFNASIARNPVAEASPAELQQWIDDINRTPEDADNRYYSRYEKCIYEARMKQLRLAMDNPPEDDVVLRRTGNGGTLAAQLGFAKADQWERDAPAREAAERAEQARQEKANLEAAEWMRRREEKRARQAAAGPTDWSGAINFFGALIGAAVEIKAQQAAAEAAPAEQQGSTDAGSSECVGNTDEC